MQTLVTNTSMAGTPKYSAPELLDTGAHYGASVDVYSVAIIVYEMFSGKDAFPGCQTVPQVINDIQYPFLLSYGTLPIHPETKLLLNISTVS